MLIINCLMINAYIILTLYIYIFATIILFEFIIQYFVEIIT